MNQRRVMELVVSNENSTSTVAPAREPAGLLAGLSKLQPGAAARWRLRDQLDPAFADTALRYAAGLLTRPQLDVRTRILVMLGQYTMLGNPRRFEETVTAGLDAEVDSRELLEVVLQCSIYRGEPAIDAPLEVIARVFDARGVLDDVRDRALPVGERARPRKLAEEQELWDEQDAADPRLPGFIEKYGWSAVSRSLVLRPRHTLDNVEFLDGLDEGFARLFYDMGYAEMYSRQVLDDRTRLLCMVGNTLAIGEIVQTRHHMRTAIRRGATPREVLEVLLQSVVIVGHPNVVPERIRDLVAIVESQPGAEW